MKKYVLSVAVLDPVVSQARPGHGFEDAAHYLLALPRLFSLIAVGVLAALIAHVANQ